MRKALVLLCVLALPVETFAEEPVAPYTLRIDAIVAAEEISSKERGEAFVVLGNFRFDHDGFYSIQASRLVIWLDPRAAMGPQNLLSAFKKKNVIPIWAIRAIYAEGESSPVIFQAAGQVVRASAIYYDVQKHQGTFVDSEIRIQRYVGETIKERLPDLVIRAKEFRARGPGHWTARDLDIFSSDYLRPSVRLHVREFELKSSVAKDVLGRLIVLADAGAKRGDGPTAKQLSSLQEELADLENVQEGTQGKLKGISARAFNVPIFGWRNANIQGDDLDQLVVKAQAGRIRSIDSGIYLGFGRKSKPFAWEIGAGLIEGRGPLLDTQLGLNAWDGRAIGRTKGAWMLDRGVDFNGFVPPNESRYWIQNRYRFDLTSKLRLDMEYTDLSDSGFLRAYDQREFKEGKDQESLGYLRWKDKVLYGTFTYQWQSMDFLAVKEQLPAGAVVVPVYDLFTIGSDGEGQPIKVQFGIGAELANLRYRDGATAAAGDFRTGRMDVDPTLFVAFNLGAIRVVPFATMRYTWYEQGLNGAAANRYAGSAGIRATTQFGRWYGNTQHIVNFSVAYENMYNVTVDASNLFAMDDTDRVTPWDGMIVRMRNRFLRKTAKGRREILNFEVLATYYPDGDAPLGVQSDGFAEIDLEWLPTDKLLFEFRSEYHYNTGDLETGSITARWGGAGDLRYWTSVRHLEGDSDVASLGAEVLVQTRWRILGLSQYDFRNGDALNQTLQIQRMGQSFLLGLQLRYDPGEDNFTFSLKFDMLEQFRKSRRKRAEEDLRRVVRYP